MESFLLAPVRSFITSRLSAALNQYVSNISIEALGVLGSEIVLNNLELRLEALNPLLDLPPNIKLTRGFVRDLRISIPWTSILSSSIEVRVDGLEVVLSRVSESGSEANGVRSRRGTTDNALPAHAPAAAPADTSGLPAWLQLRITRILANVRVSLSNVSLRYVHQPWVVGIQVRTLQLVSSSGPAHKQGGQGWVPAYAELQGHRATVFKTLAVRDLSVTFSPCATNRGRVNSAGASAENGPAGKQAHSAEQRARGSKQAAALSSPTRGSPVKSSSALSEAQASVVDGSSSSSLPVGSSMTTPKRSPPALSGVPTGSPQQQRGTPHSSGAPTAGADPVLERPLLSDCNVLVRMKICLDPDGALGIAQAARGLGAVEEGTTEEEDVNTQGSGTATGLNIHDASVVSPSAGVQGSGGAHTTARKEADSGTRPSSARWSPLEAAAAELHAASLEPGRSLLDRAAVGGLYDPFDTPSLTAFPGAVRAMRAVPSGQSGTVGRAVSEGPSTMAAPVPIDAALSQLHVYAEGFDFFLSARQARGLATVLSDLQAATEQEAPSESTQAKAARMMGSVESAEAGSGLIGADTAKASSIGDRADSAAATESARSPIAASSQPEDTKEHSEERAGVLGWLWGAVVGSGDGEEGDAEGRITIDPETGQEVYMPATTGQRSTGPTRTRGGRGSGSARDAPRTAQETAAHTLLQRVCRAVVLNLHFGSASLTLLKHEQIADNREQLSTKGSSPLRPGYKEQVKYESVSSDRPVGGPVRTSVTTASSTSAAEMAVRQGLGELESSPLMAAMTSLLTRTVKTVPADSSSAPAARTAAASSAKGPSHDQQHTKEDASQTFFVPDTEDPSSSAHHTADSSPCAERYAAVPFLRFNVGSSWLHTRLLSDIQAPTDSFQEQEGVEDGDFAAVPAGNTGVCSALQICDLYCDLGVVSVQAWSERSEMAANEARSFSKARMIALQYSAIASLAASAGGRSAGGSIGTSGVGSAYRPPASSLSSVQSGDGNAGTRGRSSSVTSADAVQPSSTPSAPVSVSGPHASKAGLPSTGGTASSITASITASSAAHSTRSPPQARRGTRASSAAGVTFAMPDPAAGVGDVSRVRSRTRGSTGEGGISEIGEEENGDMIAGEEAVYIAIQGAHDDLTPARSENPYFSCSYFPELTASAARDRSTSTGGPSGGAGGGEEHRGAGHGRYRGPSGSSISGLPEGSRSRTATADSVHVGVAGAEAATSERHGPVSARLHFSLISGSGLSRPVLPLEAPSIAATWKAVQLAVQLSSVTASMTPSFLGTLVGFMRASTPPASTTARVPSQAMQGGQKAAVYHQDAGTQPSALQPLALSFLDAEDGPQQPAKNGFTHSQHEADVEPSSRRQVSDQLIMQRRQQAPALPALDLYISCPRFAVFIDHDVGDCVPAPSQIAPVLDIRHATVHVAASSDSVAMELQQVIRTADEVLSSRNASMHAVDSGSDWRQGQEEGNESDGGEEVEEFAVMGGELSTLYCLLLLRPSLRQSEAGFQGMYAYVQTAAADLTHCGIRHAVTVGDPSLDAFLDVSRRMGAAKVRGQLSKVGVYAHMAGTAHAELALGAVTLQTGEAAVVHCVPLTASSLGSSDDQEACARVHMYAAGMPLLESPTAALHAPQLRVSMEVGRGFVSVPALQAVAAHCAPLATGTLHEASTSDFVVRGQLPVAAAEQTAQADLWSQWLLCCASGSAPAGGHNDSLKLRKAIRDSRTAPLLQLQAEIHSWSVILYDSSSSASAALLALVTPVLMVEQSTMLPEVRRMQPHAGPTHTMEMMGGAVLNVPHDVLQAWSDATPRGETHRFETNGHKEREAHSARGMFSCRPWTPSQLLAAATAQVQLDVVAKISCKALPFSPVAGGQSAGYGFTCDVEIPSVRGAVHESMVGLVLEAAAAVQSALMPVEKKPTVALQRHVLAGQQQAAASQPPAAPLMLVDAHIVVQDLKLDILTLDASPSVPASNSVLESDGKAESGPEPAVSGQREGYAALLTFIVRDLDAAVQGIPLSPGGGQPSASTIQVGTVRVMHISSHADSSQPASPMVSARASAQLQGITVFECLTLSTQYEAGQAGGNAKLAQQRGERLQVTLDSVCAHLYLPLVSKVVHLSNRIKRQVWWYLTTLYHAQQRYQEQTGDVAVVSSSAESVALLHPYRGPTSGNNTPGAPSTGSVGFGLGLALAPGTTAGGTPRPIVGSPVAVSVARFTNTAGPVSVISSDDGGTLCQAVDAAIPCVPYIALCTVPAMSIMAGVCAIKLSHRQGQQHVAYIHAGVREASLTIGESADDGDSASGRKAVDGSRDISLVQTGRTAVNLQVAGVTVSAGVAQALAAVEAFPDAAEPSMDVFASVGPTDISASATLNTKYLPAAKRLELDSAFSASITRIDGTGSVSGLMICSQTMLPALLGLSGDAVVLAAAPGEQPTETAKRIIRAASPASKTSMDDLAVHSKVTYEALFPGLSLAFHFVERASSSLHRSKEPWTNESGQVALDVGEARIRGSRDLQLSPGFVVQNADVMPTWSRVTGNGHAYLSFLTITHAAGIPAEQLGHGSSYRHHHSSRHAGHSFKVAPLLACVQAADSPWLSVDWKESGVPSTTSATNSATQGPAQRAHTRMRSSNSSSAFPSSIDPPVERHPRSQALWPVLDMTVQLQRVEVQLAVPALQSFLAATVNQNDAQKLTDVHATSKSCRAPSILPPEWFAQPAQPQLVYATTSHPADAPIRHLVRFRVVSEGLEASLATATSHTPGYTAHQMPASIVVGASQCYSAFGFILGEEMFATAPTADYLMLYEHSAASTEASRLLACDVGHVGDQFILGGTLSFYRAYASIHSSLRGGAAEGRGDRAAPLLLPCDVSLTALTRSYTPLHAAPGTAGLGVPVRSMTTILCELPPLSVELTPATLPGLIHLSTQVTQLQAAVVAAATSSEHRHASAAFDTHSGLEGAAGDIPARSYAHTVDIVHKLATLSVTRAPASHGTVGSDLASPACTFGTSAFPLDALLLAGIDISAVYQLDSTRKNGAPRTAASKHSNLGPPAQRTNASLLVWDTLDVSDDGSVLGCFEWSYPQPVTVSRVSASAPVAVPASAGSVVSSILRRQETADITCVLECRQGGKWVQCSTFTVPFTTGAQYAHSGAVLGGVSTSGASPMKRSGGETGATPHKHWHNSHAAPVYELLDYVTSYSSADRSAAPRGDDGDDAPVEQSSLPVVAAASSAAQAASTQWRVRPVFVPAQTSRGIQPQLQSTSGYRSLCIAVASVLRVHIGAHTDPGVSLVRGDSSSASPLGLYPTIHTTLLARDLTVAVYTGHADHARKGRSPLLALRLVDSMITSCAWGSETALGLMHSEEASGAAILGLQHTDIRLPEVELLANRPRDGHRYPVLSASDVSIGVFVVQSTAHHCEPVTLQTDLNVGDIVAQVHLPLVQDVLAATSSLAELVYTSGSVSTQRLGAGDSMQGSGAGTADGHLRVQNRCHLPLVLCSVRPAAKLSSAEGSALASGASATDLAHVLTTAVPGTALQLEAVGTVEAGSSAQLQLSGPPVHALALAPPPSICHDPAGSADLPSLPVPVVPALTSSSTATTPVLYDESGTLPAQVRRHLVSGHGVLRHITVSTLARRVFGQQSSPSSSVHDGAAQEGCYPGNATDRGDMDTVEYKALLGMAVDGLQGTVTITPPITFCSALEGDVLLQWRAVHTVSSVPSSSPPMHAGSPSELDRTHSGGVTPLSNSLAVTSQKSTSVLGSVWGWLSGRANDDQTDNQQVLVEDQVQHSHAQHRDMGASRHALLTDGVIPGRKYVLEGSIPLPSAPHGSVRAGPLLPTAVIGVPPSSAQDCTFSLSFTASGSAARYVSVDLTSSSLRTALTGKQTAFLIVPFSSSARAATSASMSAAETARSDTTHDFLLRLQRDTSPQAISSADGCSQSSVAREPVFMHCELLPCVRSNLVAHTEVRRGTSGTDISACWPFAPAALRLAVLGAADSDTCTPGRLRYAVSSTSSGGSTPSVAGLASLDAYASALAHIVKVQTSIVLPSVWSFDADTNTSPRTAKWSGPSDSPWLLVHAGWVKTFSTDGRAYLEPVERPANDESSTDAVALIYARAPQEHTAPSVESVAPIQVVNCLNYSVQVGYSTVALPEGAAKAMGTTSSTGMEIAAQEMSESAALPVLFQSMQGGAPSLCVQLRATSSTTPDGPQLQAPATGITVFLPLPAGPGLDQASWTHSQLLLPSADANAADMCLPISLSCHVPTGTPNGLLPQLVVTVRPRAVVKISRALTGLVGAVSSYDESSGFSVLPTCLGAGHVQDRNDAEYTILAPRTVMALVQDPPVAVCLSSHGILRFRLLEGSTSVNGSGTISSSTSRHPFSGAQGHTEVRQPAYRRGLTSSAVVHDLDIIGKALSWPSIPAGHAVRLTLSAPCGPGPGPALPVLCRADVAFDNSTGVTTMTISPEERPPVVLQTGGMTSVSYPLPVACNPGHMSAWMHAYCSPWERVAILSGLIRQLEASLRAASALRTAVPAANAGTSKSSSTSGNRTPALASSGQAPQAAGPLAADLAACEVALAYAKGGLLEDVELAEDSLRLWHEEEAEEGQEQPPYNYAGGEAGYAEGQHHFGHSKQTWQAKGQPSAPTVHPLLRLRRAAWRREPVSVQLPASSVVPFDWLLLVDTGLPFEGSPHLRTRYTGSLIPARSAEGQRPGLASIRWVPAFPSAWSGPAPASRASSAARPTTSAAVTSAASTGLMSPKAKPVPVVDIRASDLGILHVPAQTAQDRMLRLQDAAAAWRRACATAGHRSARMSTINGEDEDEQTLQQQYPTILAHGTSLRLVPGPAGTQQQHGELTARRESSTGTLLVVRCPFVNGSVLVPLRSVHALGQDSSAHSPSVRTSIHFKHASCSLLWPNAGQLVRSVQSTPGAQADSALVVDHVPSSALRELCVAHVTAARIRVDEGEASGLGQRMIAIIAAVQGLQIDDHGNPTAFTVPLSLGSPGADVRARRILAAWTAGETNGSFASSSSVSRSRRPSHPTADDLRALALSVKASFLTPPSPSYAPLRRLSPSTSSLRDLYVCPGLLRLHVTQGVLEQYAGVLRVWPETLAKTAWRLQEAMAGTVIPPGPGSDSSASLMPLMFTSSSLVVERLHAEVTLRLGESPAVSQEAGAHAMAVGFMQQTGLQHADIATDSDNPLAGLTSPLYLSVDRMHIRLSGVALDRPLCSLARLSRELVASAVTDLLLSSPAVLGSLDIVGNPTRLVRSLATGVAELVLQPTRAVWGADAARTGTGDRRTDRPVVLGVLFGLATGARSFASHVGEGALTSISGFATSLARNLELLVADEIYEESLPVTGHGSKSAQGTFAVGASGAGTSSGSASGGVGPGEGTEKAVQQAIVLQGALLLVPAPSTAQAGDATDVTTAPAVRAGLVIQPAWWSHEGTSEVSSVGLVSSAQSPNGAAQQGGRGIVSIVQNLDALSLLDGLASGLVGVVVHPLAGALDLVGQGSAGLAAALQGKDGEVAQYRPAKTIILRQR